MVTVQISEVNTLSTPALFRVTALPKWSVGFFWPQSSGRLQEFRIESFHWEIHALHFSISLSSSSFTICSRSRNWKLEKPCQTVEKKLHWEQSCIIQGMQFNCKLYSYRLYFLPKSEAIRILLHTDASKQMRQLFQTKLFYVDCFLNYVEIIFQLTISWKTKKYTLQAAVLIVSASTSTQETKRYFLWA